MCDQLLGWEKMSAVNKPELGVPLRTLHKIVVKPGHTMMLTEEEILFIKQYEIPKAKPTNMEQFRQAVIKILEADQTFQEMEKSLMELVYDDD